MSRGSSRIIGFDVARAVAVAGMVVVNFKVVMGADGDPAWLRNLTGLLDGRAAAAFVMLAGIGASLMTGRARGEDDREALMKARRLLLRRALFLLVVGYLFIPIWPADILHYYAFYIAGGAFLLSAPSSRLWMLAGAAAALFPVLYGIFGYWAELDPLLLSYRGFWTPAGLLRNLLFNGWHPVVPWIAFYLVGMWVGRCSMAEPATRVRVLAAAVAAAVAGEAAAAITTAAAGAVEYDVAISGSGDITVSTGLRALLAAEPLPPGPIYLLAAGGTALAVIMLCVEVALRRPASAPVRWLGATGRLALTMYFAHVVLGLGLLEEIGLLEGSTLVESVVSATVFVAVAIVFSVWWEGRHGRGPAERLMRSLAG